MGFVGDACGVVGVRRYVEREVAPVGALLFVFVVEVGDVM